MTINLQAAENNLIYIRVNQMGYVPQDTKVAIAFSNHKIQKKCRLIRESDGKIMFSFRSREIKKHGWANFKYYYELNFSSIKEPGSYHLMIGSSQSKSFAIQQDVYRAVPDSLLVYLRQQRCGYNPFWHEVCHRLDGRTMFAPFPDSAYLDASGGWHDAGDDLKYLLTTSYAVPVMLMAYQTAPGIFADSVNSYGETMPNGLPDILDEAKWGLDWMHKLHPAPDMLFHQVADDRDHIGWKKPGADSSDYGWGSNSYRVVYFADGKPQGLRKYKSNSDGVANLAGRYAAAMALAYRIWEQQEHRNSPFAQKCLKAAGEVYRLGKQKEGVQQGNSYWAPYRYAETTWADDMEWGAAELFKATADSAYLQDAIRYARMAGAESWMGRDTTDHYQYYPFMNMGHYVLYPLVNDQVKTELAGYYRDGIEKCLSVAKENPFKIGVPFIWCSNNLAVALISQCYLYEQMTGDQRYHALMIAARDWLLGRNPWGTTMFVGIPANGEFPEHPHASTYALTGRQITGGMVDGPIYASIYQQLKGIYLSKADEFASYQTDYVVYHDDIADYSSNEPTMDGTAAAIFALTVWAGNQEK
ncbi:MAG: glycoside hydrolase family 9 protein [Calditrichia bacterium]